MFSDCSQGTQLGEDFFEKYSMTRIISCASYLKDENGHGLAYHSAFETVIQTLGLKFEAYISKDSNPSIKSSWKRYFSKKHSSKLLEGFKRFQEYFFLLQRFRHQKTIIFLESFSLIELAALYFAFFITFKKPILWILLRYPRELLPINGKIHSFIFKKMHPTLSLFTDSERIAESFSTHQLTVLPIPHTEMPMNPSKVFKKEYKMWWPGEPRVQKGLKEIQYISTLSNDEFTLLVSESTPLLLEKLRVQRVANGLPREFFLNIFNECDIILLPYDPSFYRASTSGLFVEAIIGNKIPFVKKDTWLADECLKYNLKELIIEWERVDVLDSIKNTMNNLSLKERLDCMKSAYMKFHSLKTFSKIIQSHLHK